MIARLTVTVRWARGLYGLLLMAGLLLFAGVPVAADITSNLILHHPFDSDASDSSGKNHHGMLTNGASIDTNAGTNKIGGGKLSLDGNNDYVDLSAHAGSFQNVSEGTIAAWVYADTDATGVIFEASDSGDETSRIVLIRDGSALVFAIHDEPIDYIEVETSTNLVPLQTWTHVAITVDSSGNKFYVNGAQVVSKLTYFEGSPSTSRFFDDVSNLDFVAWGVNKENGSQFNTRFDGFIDDGRVYDRALTASDIAELHSYPPTTTIQVNTTSDVLSGDADTSSLAALIASPGSDGVISLREAITAANTQSGTDTIAFEIPEPLVNGAHTIVVGSGGLPDITDGTIIDGTTDNDFSSTPVIELDGSSAGHEIGLNLTGGSSTVRGLVINRFERHGMRLVSSGNHIIQGNYIGTNVTGSADLGNNQLGILIASANNTIGGTSPGEGNVISGNGWTGVSLQLDGADGNVIQGNLIGTDASGTVAIGNSITGIDIFNNGPDNNVIGGTAAGARNIISGNANRGIVIRGVGATGNTVLGNYIGSDISGTLPIPNGQGGIRIQQGATGSIIGGTTTDAANLIAFNSGDGVEIEDTGTTANAIQGNRIHSNSGLGIDLNADGVTVSDVDDADIGPNALLNFPVLNAAVTTGAQLAIQGSMTGTAATAFRLEFFANTTADDSGYGEGERYLGFRTVTTAATGTATFNLMLSAAVAAGEFITATATHLAANNTSEFAFNVTAATGLDSDSDGVLDVAEDRNLDGDGDPATGPPLDTDGDGTPDYLDIDDDGDGTTTAKEDTNGNGDPTDDDTDGDGIPNYLDPDDAGPGPGDSDKDGIADDVECPSGPPCTDTDGDGIPNYNDPDHNTFVKHLVLDAIADTTGVWIQWVNSWERNNLGFQVYREVGGVWAQITPSLVAGSALLAGPGTILPAGHGYAWHDPAGMPEDRYLLVDVDINGKRTRHGPFQAHSIGPPGPASPYVPTPLLRQLGRHQAHPPAHNALPRHATDTPLHPLVTTPLQPPRWEIPGRLSPVAVQHALAAAPALIFTIREEGWYRISQADLIRAGLDAQIDPRDLHLFAGGRPQPLHITGEDDGRLDLGDAIAFYGVGHDTPWTDTQAYWLAVGTQPGTRLQQVEARGQPRRPTSFPLTIKQQERRVYIAAIKNGRDENFFGAVVAADPIEQVLHLAHLDPDPPGEAHLAVTLHGVTSQRHLVTVRLNHHEAGTLTVPGRAPVAGVFAVPQSWLLPGANVVTLAGAAGEQDISVVKSVHLTYWQTYTAKDDRLRCTAPGQQPVSLRGFTTDAIRVFDITDPETTHELLGTVTPENQTYRIAVTPKGTGERILLAIGTTQRRSPVAFMANAESAWHRPDQGADLVIIAHANWLDRLIPLQTLREQQGWSVALIDIQALYNEWNFGNKDPQVITAFLRHAAAYWQTPPRFVLLAGDASFDPRDYLGQGPSDWIPTTWVNTTEMETASDDALADIDGDGIADVAIGRLPLRSAAEADEAVAKLVAYEAAAGSWHGRSLVVTDREGDFDFAGAVQPLVRQLHSAMAVTTLSAGTIPIDTARRQLHQHLATGQLLVTYMGHGSIDRWQAQGLLTTSAVQELTNGPRLPVVLSMTCLNGFFHDLYTESMAEALIRAPRGGAVAVWASSGLTRPTAQTAMQQALVTHLLSDERPTLGEAVQAAKASIADADVQQTWILLGDPTLRLKRSR